MFEIPLFPLNPVLFPYTPIHLHVFEKRYLQMIGKCIMKKQPFGVVLIKHGSEAFGPLADPYMVGCTAEITRVERLAGGELDIVAIGRERFRIVSLDYHSQPYLVGKVERDPLEIGDPALLVEAGQKLRPELERFVQTLTMSQAVFTELQSFPDEPLRLAYLSAAILQSPSREKQALLEARNAGEMIMALLSMLRKETALMKAFVSKKQSPEQGSFSSN